MNTESSDLRRREKGGGVGGSGFFFQIVGVALVMD